MQGWDKSGSRNHLANAAQSQNLDKKHHLLFLSLLVKQYRAIIEKQQKSLILASHDGKRDRKTATYRFYRGAPP
jgi:hypothetical protein